MAETQMHPVIGWALHKIAGTAVLLDLQTVASGGHLAAVSAGTAEPDHLPALLTPEQCLELSAALQRAAAAILAQETPPRSGQH